MHLPLIWIDWGKLLYRIHFSGKINLFNLRENEELVAHKTILYCILWRTDSGFHCCDSVFYYLHGFLLKE